MNQRVARAMRAANRHYADGGDVQDNRSMFTRAADATMDYAGRGLALGDLYTGGMLSSLAGLNPFGSYSDVMAAREKALAGVPREAKALATEPINPVAAIFAGPMARTANKVMLRRAEELAAQNAPREQIWQETGWFQGPDKKWRFEIDDSGASLRTPEQSAAMLSDLEAQRRAMLDLAKQSRVSEKLQPDLFPKHLAKARGELKRRAGDIRSKIDENYGLTWRPELGRRAGYVMDHPGAFAAYPEDTRQLIVSRYTSPPEHGVRGEYDRSRISLFKGPHDERSTALHEYQHRVQEHEGFAEGGNPGQFAGASSAGGVDPYEQYRKLAGEVEARAVQSRLNLSPIQRRARAPWLDYDVPESEQIVRMP